MFESRDTLFQMFPSDYFINIAIVLLLLGSQSRLWHGAHYSLHDRKQTAVEKTMGFVVDLSMVANIF